MSSAPLRESTAWHGSCVSIRSIEAHPRHAPHIGPMGTDATGTERGMQRRLDELRFLFSRAALARLARSFGRDDLVGHAAEVAFYALFALLPFLLLVSAVAQWLVANPSEVMGRLFVVMHSFMPAGTA